MATFSTGGSSAANCDDFGSTLTGLYAVDSSAKLWSINPSTGAATLIGPLGISPGGFGGLSTNSSTLYFADGANLYTLDTSTGAATLVGGIWDLLGIGITTLALLRRR